MVVVVVVVKPAAMLLIDLTYSYPSWLSTTTPPGGKKRNFHHDVIWNIKYLKGFKWRHLTEKLGKVITYSVSLALCSMWSDEVQLNHWLVLIVIFVSPL